MNSDHIFGIILVGVGTVTLIGATLFLAKAFFELLEVYIG